MEAWERKAVYQPLCPYSRNTFLSGGTYKVCPQTWIFLGSIAKFIGYYKQYIHFKKVEPFLSIFFQLKLDVQLGPMNVCVRKVATVPLSAKAVVSPLCFCLVWVGYFSLSLPWAGRQCVFFPRKHATLARSREQPFSIDLGTWLSIVLLGLCTTRVCGEGFVGVGGNNICSGALPSSIWHTAHTHQSPCSGTFPSSCSIDDASFHDGI